MSDKDPKSERQYFHDDLINMIRTRYGNMTVYETIGVMELVKYELMASLPKKSKSNE